MNWLIGFLFVVGLGIAGVESPWFPWLNFGGVVLIAASGILADIVFHQPHSLFTDYYPLQKSPYPDPATGKVASGLPEGRTANAGTEHKKWFTAQARERKRYRFR